MGVCLYMVSETGRSLDRGIVCVKVSNCERVCLIKFLERIRWLSSGSGRMVEEVVIMFRYGDIVLG